MLTNSWQIRDRTLIWGIRTYVMGVINVTPDSFSDGGLFNTSDKALLRASSIADYVDILDIGGESTRPGAESVDIELEIQRVVPVISAIRQQYPNLPISIDTRKAAVAKAALDAGADIVNDISAGRFDPDILPLVARRQVPIILMHMQGEPYTMQTNPSYRNLIKEVKQFLTDAVSVAIASGIPKHLIAIDPGIGFGKTMEHNLELLRHLSEFQDLGCPSLVGLSRKSFIGKLCNHPNPVDRIWGTTAACTVAIAGGVDILRVHDPKEIGDVCRVADAVYRRANLSESPSINSLITSNLNLKTHLS